MKQITKERILKALDKTSTYLDNKPEVHIMRTLATAGFRSVCNDAFGVKADPFTEKDRLELAYQGFSDPEKILRRLSHWSASRSIDSVEAIREAWFHSWEETLKRYWARGEKIIALQVKHGISSLEEEEFDFGNAVVKYHEPHYQLELLDSDWEVLRNERMILADAFLSAVQFHEMRLYRRSHRDDDDNWLEASPYEVLPLANVYSWAKVWSHRSYVNYKELKERGYTQAKSVPAPDHEFEWDIHLSVGSGDLDSSHDYVWFCGRIGKGKPSL